MFFDEDVRGTDGSFIKIASKDAVSMATNILTHLKILRDDRKPKLLQSAKMKSTIGSFISFFE